MRDATDRLEVAEDELWRRGIRIIRSSLRWQFWIKVSLILAGAVIGGIGGGMEGPLQATTSYAPTIKGLCVVGGGMASFAGGLLLLFADQDIPALLASSRDLSREAKTHLVERDALQNRLAAADIAAERLDRTRRERLSAIERMLEVVEAALLSGADVGQTADRMLLQAIHAIHKAVDYEGGDFFTISIFQKKDCGQGERLYRVAAQWSDPVRAGEHPRDWQRGFGYTGVAWDRAVGNPGAEVIESDTSLGHIPVEYPVEFGDPAREALYMSVAAIPILVGEHDDVWGVVTATSDRRGVFRRDPSALGTQNVAVIRDIARFAGLLAGVDRLPKSAGPPRVRWFGRT